MGQQGGTCWNAESGQPNPEFFGGVMVLELAFRSVVPFAGLFQDCLPRRHHPRVWGFLLPTDRTPSVIKSLNRLRGTVDTVSAHHQITGAACQRGTAELA